MKTLPSCLCILGFTTASAVAGSVLLDQVGPDDGTNIDVSNMLANQLFEAAFSAYNISVADDFDNPAGQDIMSAEFVMGGWNGYAGPTGVTGFQVNVHSSVAGVCTSLAGDLLTSDIAAADADIQDGWGGLTGYAKIGLSVEASAGAGTMLAISVIPSNEFGSNGQTGMAISFEGDATATQNNPNGGFGFGDCQDTGYSAAIRLMGGASDPCDSALAAVCAADVSGPNDEPDGLVNVSDLLAVIANWGAVGDGTYRPMGDCAPAPNGDCAVNVTDLLAVIGDWGSDCIARGSCCYDDGSCMENVAEADCDGAWGGAGSDCSSCTSGACCATDGSCATSTEAACGGTYQGDGTDCADADCPVASDNNTCDTAIPASNGDNDIDTNGATTDGPEDFTMCDNFGVEQIYNDLYWTYTADCDGDVTVSLCNSVDFDSRIAVYNSCAFDMVACNDDALSGACGLTSEVTFAASSGASYVFRIGSFSDGGTGSGTFNVSCAGYETGACCIGLDQCVDGLLPPDCAAFGGTHQGGGTDCSVIDCDPTPANDTCEGATEAVLGPNAFDTSYANPEWPDPDDSLCAGTYLDWAGSADVFFTYTPSSNGTLSMTTCDAASYDTSIAVYTGDCSNATQVSCNGDHSGQADCQSYYSAIDSLPVVGGEQVIIRIGGWNGATGAGTLTLTFTGGDEEAACCVGGSCAGETTYSDCNARGGLWFQGDTCATVSCPQPFNGCDGSEDVNEEDFGCYCFEDGDDALDDCNPGLNGDGTMTPYTLGDTVCGSGSVYLDASGGTYRDTDWWDDGGAVDAGGTFGLQVGSGAAQLLGIVDLDALAFVDYVINTEGAVSDTYDVTVGAGNYCIWVGPSDWNTAWTCASGAADYVFSVN